MKPFFYFAILSCYLLIASLLCTTQKIHLKYALSSYLLKTTQWNNVGTFILKKGGIRSISSDDYIIKKKELWEQIKTDANYDYILFRLCFDIEKGTDEDKNYVKDDDGNNEEEKRCLQTYVNKRQLKDAEDFLIQIVLDINNTPAIINFKAYNYFEIMPRDKLDIFLLKNASVTEPIDLNNLIINNKVKPSKKKNEEKETYENGKNNSQSFLSKYWYAIVTFFLFLSISRHFTDSLQQTYNDYNVQQAQ